MSIDRRSALKKLAVLGTAAAASVPAVARTRKYASAGAVALLYDATRCIGCKTCMVACRQANNLRYGSPSSSKGAADRSRTWVPPPSSSP